MTLDELALKYGTDKSSRDHGYTRHYEQIMGPFRGRSILLVEIGVASGASLLMWREYLGIQARIVGIDIRSDGETLSRCGEADIGIFMGDQRNGKFLNRLIDKIGSPDVIIDDGGHKSSEQIPSFSILFPRLKSGGIYIVEDTHAFHDPGYIDASPSALEFFGISLIRAVNVGGRGMTGNFDRALAFSHGPPLPAFAESLESLQFYQSMLVARRR